MDINSIKQRLNSLQSSGQKKEKVDYSKYYWKPKQEGKYQMIWDGKDGYGADLPNGNYIYQLHTNNGIHSSGKVTLNRN